MECKECGNKMRLITGQAAEVNIFQCDKCKRVDGESALKAIFG